MDTRRFSVQAAQQVERDVFKELASRISSSGYRPTQEEAKILSVYSTSKKVMPWVGALSGAGIVWLMSTPIVRAAPRFRPARTAATLAAGAYSAYTSYGNLPLAGLAGLASTKTPIGGEVAAILKENRPDVYKVVFSDMRVPPDQPRILTPEAAEALIRTREQQRSEQAVDSMQQLPSATADSLPGPAQWGTQVSSSLPSTGDAVTARPSRPSDGADGPADFALLDNTFAAGAQEQWEDHQLTKSQRIERWKQMHERKHSAGHHAGDAAPPGTSFDPRWDDTSGVAKPSHRTNAYGDIVWDDSSVT